MGPKATYRAIQARERQLQREAQRRQHELARLEKEKAKLSAIEQARLEVETYENKLDVLLSVHKEPCEQWDWVGLASALPHPAPKNYFHHELRAKQSALVDFQGAHNPAHLTVEQARALDEKHFEEMQAVHHSEAAEIARMRELALRVLAGDHMAYIEAFADLNPVAEISSVGSLKQFAVESDVLIQCVFKVNANEVIPSQVKTLTASNKVSTKPMPKSQFHEIYQDYVSACVIRIAREILAMLPVEVVLVTALAEIADAISGQMAEQPVLSVAFSRGKLATVDLETLGAGNVADRFLHRSNFRMSRKAGAFQQIIPLTPIDLLEAATNKLDVFELESRIRALRNATHRDAHQLDPSLIASNLAD